MSTQSSNAPDERSGTPASAPDPALLELIVRRVVEAAAPDRIILFGSASRGELRPGSDIDLLVIKAGVGHRRRLAQDIYMNLSGVGIPVDVVVATPEDIQRFGSRVGSVLEPALREGRVIHDA
jgi:uncharacterized protein